MRSSIVSPEGPAQQVREIGDQLADIRQFRVERLAPLEGQQLLRQLGAVIGRILRLAQQDAQFLIVEPSLDHLEIAADDGEEVVEVVGDAAGQLAHRLHLLGLAQLLFHPVAAGEVADEAGEDALAAGAGLADRQFHGKAGAVLAQAGHHPPIADDAPLARRQVAHEM